MHAPASGPVVWHTGRLGSGQLGAPSATHETHTCVVGLQFGVTPPQSAAPRQPTHTPPPDVVSQSGRDVGQREASVAVHTPHAPLGRHSGVAAPHSPLLAQARQVAVAPSHTGCVAGQAPAFPGAQVAQVPPAVQTGVCAGHSASRLHVRHTWAVPSQIGAAPVQSEFATQPAHWPALTSHTAVAPVHIVLFAAEQVPQAPVGWQAGVAPPQSASPPHGRQACVAPSQAGVVPPHCAATTQPTQVPLDGLHTGVAPVHVTMFVAEQAPHAPPGWQAGV
ncbi:MAG TPA: hypothetical protein VLT58_12825, partial [Polyangia bacterium]|nr:hypothetical protein [Polyangia bacterium]